MYNLRRFWNQNRIQIIRVIAIIVFILIIIQLINYFVKRKNEEELSNMEQKTITTNDESNNGLVSEQSAITGTSVSKEQLNTATTIINQFVSYCNQQDLENAYNLLTDECKQQMYTSLEVFRQAYYNDVFNGEKKTCTIENWFGDTYQVRIMENLLATGKDNGGYAKQDYITVKRVKGEYKLNINNYIGYSQINKTTTNDNISMEVLSKNTYKEYEEYTIKVTNNTENSVQLDDVNNAKTLYLEDSKGIKYSYYNHELTEQELTIAAGQTKEVTIKFYSSYVSTKEIRYIVFSNIIETNENLLTEKIEFVVNV